ncbi:MAG: winged helix-turn-helix domain-containing protein [Candidatus Thermoplasmatota archaeon]
MDDASPPPRPDLYVVARFLDRLGESPGGHLRTKLQQAVRLNYDLYRSYLSWLTTKGWVEVIDERVVLTKAGLDARERLLGWIRDAFGDIRL